MKKLYHPRVEVNYKATMPFIRAFPQEAVEQHVRCMQPTNPPNVDSEVAAIQHAVTQQMSGKGPADVQAPRFVVTTPTATALVTSDAPAPLQLKAEAPVESTAPRFEVPATPPPVFIKPTATHGVRTQPPLYARAPPPPPAPEVSTDMIVLVVGAGVMLGLGWFLYTKWSGGAAPVVDLPDVTPQ